MRNKVQYTSMGPSWFCITSYFPGHRTGRRPAVLAGCLLNLVLSFLLTVVPNITMYIILKAIIELLQALYYIGAFIIGELTEESVVIILLVNCLSNFLM